MSHRVATPLPSPHSCFLARSGHFVEVGGCKKGGKKEAEEKEKSGPFVASDVLLIL